MAVPSLHSEVPLTLVEEPPQTLSVWDQGAFWANLGVSLLGFSGALALINPLGDAPLSFAAALTAAVIGSIIGTSMVGLAAIPGAQTGSPAMVLLRGLFGARLSYVPTVLNIIQLLGWGAFELWVIAMGSQAIFGDTIPREVWIIAAGILTIALTIWPLGSIRVLRRYVTAGVVLSMVWLSVALFSQAGSLSGGSWTAFPAAIDYVIALSVSWVPLAADYARHSRSSKAAFTGVVGGYTIAQVACLALGVAAVALVGSDVVTEDNTAVFTPFVAAPLGAAFFGILVLREADQSFANVYSTAASLQNLMPRIDRRIFSVAIGVVTIALAIFVNADIYAAFLGLIGAVFVPMFAVLAVDYFLLRGSRRWNTAEDAPARWTMLVPWILGFATYWIIAPLPDDARLSWWKSLWEGVRGIAGFAPQAWMSAALFAFVVASIVTLAVGLISRTRG